MLRRKTVTWNRRSTTTGKRNAPKTQERRLGLQPNLLQKAEALVRLQLTATARWMTRSKPTASRDGGRPGRSSCLLAVIQVWFRTSLRSRKRRNHQHHHQRRRNRSKRLNRSRRAIADDTNVHATGRPSIAESSVEPAASPARSGRRRGYALSRDNGERRPAVAIGIRQPNCPGRDEPRSGARDR